MGGFSCVTTDLYLSFYFILLVALFYLTAVIAILLLTRDIFLNSSDAREKAKSMFGEFIFFSLDRKL